jgi:predicted metal-dependent peptidase
MTNLETLMQRAPANVLQPTRAWLDKVELCRSWLVVNAPFFADLAYRKLPIVFSRDIPIAATDGFCILLNPEPFFKYELREQVFIIAHEVLHYVFGDVFLMHMWRKAGAVQVSPGVILPYDDDLMNRAEDYRINAMLIASNVGRFNPDWLYDTKLSERGFETSVEIYAKLFKQSQDDGKDGKGKGGGKDDGHNRPDAMRKRGPSGGPAQFDVVMEPGEAEGNDPDEVAGRASDADRAVAVAQAMQAAETMGQMPASLKRTVSEILDPKVDWQDKIRSTLFRRLYGDGYDWSMPDRRMIARDWCGPYQPVYFARSTNTGCGDLVIGVDVSGSVTNKMVDRFFAEMQGIVEAVNPARLVVLWCDAKVQRADALEEVSDLSGLHADIKRDGAPGGGGTDFRPVFTDVDKLGLEPEALVYFTDLEGRFPQRAPSYPVVWACINGKVAPWGDTVRVEL